MSRKITVEHDGETYDGQAGTIVSSTLGYEDHGILSVMVQVEWPGGGVGVGGYALDEYSGDIARRVTTAYGLDFVVEIMRTVGVESWEKLPGRPVIVLFDENHAGWGGRSVGLAHATDESKVFIMAKHAEAWKEKVGTTPPGIGG